MYVHYSRLFAVGYYFHGTSKLNFNLPLEIRGTGLWQNEELMMTFLQLILLRCEYKLENQETIWNLYILINSSIRIFHHNTIQHSQA